VRVLGIGEILWDVFPEQELLGGAALNFCANSQRLGNSAALVTAVGHDARGKRALDEMSHLGLINDFVQTVDGLVTGEAIVTRDASGDPSFEITRPAAFDDISLTPTAKQQIKAFAPDWLYFGTLLQTSAQAERTTRELIQSLPSAHCFYDMNLRDGHWNIELVRRLSNFASILKLNEREARILTALELGGMQDFHLEYFCRNWATQYKIEVICVTLGAQGCFVYQHDIGLRVPGYATTVQDTVGAGDAFAAAFLHGYNQQWPVSETAAFANALGALVASKSGAVPIWTLQECLAIVHAGSTKSPAIADSY
jgi:fructokinase